MKAQFREDPDLNRQIWEKMMEYGKVYQTCVALGKCDPDPDYEAGEYTPVTRMSAHES